jgi:excisionase family DNA binding protein
MEKTIIVTTNDFITVGTAAKKLHRSRMTIYRWIDAGKLLSMKMGDVVFIPNSEVSRLLRETD